MSFEIKISGWRDVLVGQSVGGRRGYWWKDDKGESHFFELDPYLFRVFQELDVARKQVELRNQAVGRLAREKSRQTSKVRSLRYVLRMLRSSVPEEAKKSIAWILEATDDLRRRRR